ncbi:SDR family oxidoreductase [Candidatus Bipolaricaulota bacterium]|nr:SDR family oxidoreductase [Candidatus Bipolaricaulota bacterium]
MSTPHALITGSTRGIGLAIASQLARSGYVPILNYVHDDERANHALAHLQHICTGTRLIQADVATESGVQSLFERAREYGPIEVLVNNVGKFLFKPFLETSLDEWSDILDSNLTSTVLCCKQVLPFMRAQHKGHIINIAAMHASDVRARPNTLPYAIAKSGVIHLTQTLAKTEAPYGIRVNAVCPGFIAGGDHTNPDDVAKIPLGRLGQPQDIAAVIRFLVSEESAYMTGAILEIHGGALL